MFLGLLLELVGTVAEELGGGDVECQRHVGSRFETGGVDGREDQVERGAGAGDVWGESAFVTQSGVQTLFLQHRLQRVVHLGAPPHRFFEVRRADRGNHELLDIHTGVGVRRR